MTTIYTDGRQGPPGPLAASVTDLESLADLYTKTFVPGTLAYVDAPLNAYYSWSPEDTRIPDGSTVIAGKKGNWILHATQTGAVALSGIDGVVPLANGVTIEQTQIAVEALVPLSIQPSEPGTGAFQIATEAALFNSTYDNVLHVGYNVFGQVADEPQVRWSAESNYEQVPGQHCVEMHAQILDPAFPARGFNRPFSTQYWRGDGRMFTGLEYSDGGHPAGTGSLGIVETSTGTQQTIWVTGEMILPPTNYRILAANGLAISSLGANSTIQIGAGTGNANALVVDSANNRSVFQQGGRFVLLLNSTDLNACVPVTFSTPAAAPPPPPDGFTLYVDVADGKLKAIAASGTITVLASQ